MSKDTGAMRLDDGGPAFPQADLSEYGIGPSQGNMAGMSLRDWFAGQALAGMMSSPDVRPCDEVQMKHAAERLYQFADAMLAQRAKEAK